MDHVRRTSGRSTGRLALTAAVFLTAAGTREQRAPPDVSVQIFECGSGDFKDVSSFSSGEDKGVPHAFVVPCYLIRHPRGTLFWDAGLPDSLVRMPNGWAPGTGNITFRVKRTLGSQLAAIGFRPTDATYLARRSSSMATMTCSAIARS
jgi:N-acyl homoserine lactone hydrolase